MAQDKREQWEKLNNQYSVIRMALETLYRKEDEMYDQGRKPGLDEVLERNALSKIASDLSEKMDKIMEGLVEEKVASLKESYGLTD